VKALVVLAILLGTSAPARGDRAAADVDQTIRKHAGKLKACYTRLRDKDRSLKVGGKVTVKLTINRDGTTAQVRVDPKKSTLRHDRLSSCVVGVFRSMQFGADTNEAKVSYPLLFSSP
jgi:hypothetical protein